MPSSAIFPAPTTGKYCKSPKIPKIPVPERELFLSFPDPPPPAPFPKINNQTSFAIADTVATEPLLKEEESTSATETGESSDSSNKFGENVNVDEGKNTGGDKDDGGDDDNHEDDQSSSDEEDYETVASPPTALSINHSDSTMSAGRRRSSVTRPNETTEERIRRKKEDLEKVKRRKKKGETEEARMKRKELEKGLIAVIKSLEALTAGEEGDAEKNKQTSPTRERSRRSKRSERSKRERSKRERSTREKSKSAQSFDPNAPVITISHSEWHKVVRERLLNRKALCFLSFLNKDGEKGVSDLASYFLNTPAQLATGRGLNKSYPHKKGIAESEISPFQKVPWSRTFFDTLVSVDHSTSGNTFYEFPTSVKEVAEIDNKEAEKLAKGLRACLRFNWTASGSLKQFRKEFPVMTKVFKEHEWLEIVTSLIAGSLRKELFIGNLTQCLGHI